MFRTIRTAGLVMLSSFVAANLCAAPAHADAGRKLMIHRVLCDIYDKQHDNRDEMSEYTILDKMAPSDPAIQYGFGLFLTRQKEHQLAIVHLKRATQIDGSQSAYWVALGNEYLQTRNFQGAADAFHSAGPQYAAQEKSARDYLQQLRQYNEYNKRLKEQQEDQ